LASTTSAKTALGTTDLTLGYMDHPFGADQFYGPYTSWENTKTWFAGIRQQVDEDTEIDFSFRRHSDLFVLERDDPSLYTNHHVDHSYVADVRRRKEFKPTIHLYYGLEALHESIDSNNLGIHARSRGAVYAAADFRALKRFSLTVSAREEAYRLYSAEFSPTVAGGFWIDPHWKLRASASRAFRVPTYTDLYYNDPANVGNPNLRPERAWTYEAGVDWSPASKVHAALTVFERRERDGIDYYRTDPDAIWQALNIDNLTFRGIEASVRLSGGLDFRYAYLHGSQDTVPIGATKYSFNYPVHSFVANWQRALPAGLLFRTRLGVLDRLARPTYALWDVYAGRSRGTVHPFVQVTNITNADYQEILGVLMPGRSILGGVELAMHRK
jgi:iron complex outermembrane recepter protein